METDIKAQTRTRFLHWILAKEQSTVFKFDSASYIGHIQNVVSDIFHNIDEFIHSVRRMMVLKNICEEDAKQQVFKEYLDI